MATSQDIHKKQSLTAEKVKLNDHLLQVKKLFRTNPFTEHSQLFLGY